MGTGVKVAGPITSAKGGKSADRNEFAGAVVRSRVRLPRRKPPEETTKVSSKLAPAISPDETKKDWERL